MNDTELVQELFGQDVARKVIRSNKYAWDSIQSALTTPYQDWELEYPEESTLTTPRPNTRVALCDDSLAIVRRAKHEYKLNNEKEAITKLLRFGISDMGYRWNDELMELDEVDEAASITSIHLLSDDFTQSILAESDDINIPSRQPVQESSRQVRILWYEKQLASNLSERLGLPMTEILRCGILVAGKELGRIGDLPEPQEEKLEKSIAKFDTQIQRRLDRAEQLVFGAIDKTADTPYTREVIDELRTKCPQIWENYRCAHKEMADVIEHS